MRQRHGITLLDQLLVLLLLGVLLAIAFRGAAALRDTLAVQAAGRAVRDAFAFAREQAAASGTRTAVRLGRTDSRLVVHSGPDSLLRLPLAQRYGVSLSSTRDSMAYLPSGLGFGAANMRLELARGARRDTITVSRLGRVR